MLEVTDLSVSFVMKNETVRAVSSVSFALGYGDKTAVIGESGCGKTVLALAMLNLLPQTARVDGSIRFNGKELTLESEARTVRGRDIGMSWSNAENYFNPIYTVGEQISEAYRIHHPSRKKEAREKTLSLMEKLNFPQPDKVFRSYPHQLSGGMNQRAMIAMSLINDPSLVIIDEPTRGLDDRNREMVMDTIHSLGNISIFLITHDLYLAERISNFIMVMRQGIILETAAKEAFFSCPHHPYSIDLLHSVL
ncbi:ABC transporter ATP-binding protein [bacterium]|nr:ABC transporter ATP-binding protein [bacterium]